MNGALQKNLDALAELGAEALGSDVSGLGFGVLGVGPWGYRG